MAYAWCKNMSHIHQTYANIWRIYATVTLTSATYVTNAIHRPTFAIGVFWRVLHMSSKFPSGLVLCCVLIFLINYSAHFFIYWNSISKFQLVFNFRTQNFYYIFKQFFGFEPKKTTWFPRIFQLAIFWVEALYFLVIICRIFNLISPLFGM